MLLSMLFDDEDETVVSALFQVGDQVSKGVKAGALRVWLLLLLLLLPLQQ